MSTTASAGQAGCSAGIALCRRLQRQGKLAVYKLHVDEHPELSAAFRIRSIPALRVFQGGQIVKEFGGAMSRQALEQQLAEFLQ